MRFRKIFALLLVSALAFSCENDAQMSLQGGTGQAGSMTRFAISGHYLYLAGNSTIKVFNIGQGEFVLVREVSTPPGMETIFTKGDYLYLGANDGMYIYSIADPIKPSFIFRYEHVVACDPVVVQENRAYVTIRSDGGCIWGNRNVNALEIIDISDPYLPVVIRSYPMISPYGLGIDGTTLFLCEGESGFKVFDVTNELDIVLIEHRRDFFAYDVIPRQGVATVTGQDGIFQFSYGGTKGLTFLSKIAVSFNE